MPKLHFPSERGDLYVKVIFVMPTSLSVEQRSALLTLWDGNTSSNGENMSGSNNFHNNDDDDEDEENGYITDL